MLMRPYALFYLYRRRLRLHAVEELLAGVGVAVAVALVFATLVANNSIGSSSTEVVHRIVGRASLQLRALSPEGFDERLLGSVERMPYVKQAAPLLEVPATIVTPRGRTVNLTILGADLRLGILDGLAHKVPEAVFSERALALTSASAAALHIAPSELEGAAPQHVAVKLRGRVFPLKVSAVLGQESGGALSQVLAAAMPLESLQAFAGLKGRVSRILVQPQTTHGAAVRTELETLAADRIAVASADEDIALLRQALRPSDLASTFFAAVAALLGFLFAFNAVLLTVPERRQAIARFRLGGAKRSAILQMLLFQALCLGFGASLIGLGVGYALALEVFHQRPGYLAQAFVLGNSIVIGWAPPVLAVLGGVLATCLASMIPALDLRRGRPLDAVDFENGDSGNALTGVVQFRLALAASVLLAFATAIFLLAPSLALAACVAVAVAAVLATPLIFAGVLAGAALLARCTQRLTTLQLAVMSLRRTTLRSLALVMTGAVALFGAVALSGARGDLLNGLEEGANAYRTAGEVWVLNPGDLELATGFLADNDLSRLTLVPGIASIRELQAGFIDIGDRRAAVFAAPDDAGQELLRSQIVAGNAASAPRRLREGGWVAVSQQLAAEHHVTIGGVLTLPTPSGPDRLRVAALTTNVAWPGGAVIMNTRDSNRLWATKTPTVLVAKLTPGTDVERARREIAAALGTNSGLEVLAATTWARRFLSLANEGLSQLQWISLMLLAAAILAMAAALTATIWQQRRWLSGLRLSAAPSYRLRRILLVQSAITLGAGCLTGALAGFYGQVILDAYLKHVTGFPVTTLASGWRPLAIFAVAVAIALGIAVLPGWRASRVPLALALERE
jgi:putative ABC transport system permease protein